MFLKITILLKGNVILLPPYYKITKGITLKNPLLACTLIFFVIDHAISCRPWTQLFLVC
jgi:hypothetical protein